MTRFKHPEVQNDLQHRDDDEQARATQGMTPITLPEALVLLAIGCASALFWAAAWYGLWAWVTR